MMADLGRIYCIVLMIGAAVVGSLVMPADSQSSTRTESICNLGMVKGDTNRICEVPIPADCTVADFPGYDQHWVDISKAGATTCRFSEQDTDWKTRIVGVCDTCTTHQCSARFSVMFNCSSNIPPGQSSIAVTITKPRLP